MKTPHGFFFNMLCFLGCGEGEMLHIQYTTVNLRVPSVFISDS